MLLLIAVTRLNNKEFYVNPDLIEFIEESPNTVITLTTGTKLVVNESAEILIERIVAFRHRCRDYTKDIKNPY